MSSPQPPSSAEQHQAQQAALAAALAVAVAQAFGALDPTNLTGSIPKLQQAVAGLVARYGRMSATVAARFYRRERLAAGVTGRVTVVVAKPAGQSVVAPQVAWAVSPLWDKPAGLDDAALATQLHDKLDAALTKTQGIAESLTLDAGRDTVINAVQHDRQAKGWARVPEPDACYFCAMLATRGAVYRSEWSADFHPHDHCRCHVEPVFNAYEPTAQIRDWQAQWREVTADANGMAAKQLAWRRHYEGRTPATPEPAPRPEHVMTDAQVRKAIALLERSLPKMQADPQFAPAAKAAEARLDELRAQLLAHAA
jgi:hypothetical protein